MIAILNTEKPLLKELIRTERERSEMARQWKKWTLKRSLMTKERTSGSTLVMWEAFLCFISEGGYYNTRWNAETDNWSGYLSTRNNYLVASKEIQAEKWIEVDIENGDVLDNIQSYQRRERGGEDLSNAKRLEEYDGEWHKKSDELSLLASKRKIVIDELLAKRR